ncbi:hypothetical protein SRABI13_03669 [Erwinia aphidicola]|uniref:aspartyl protease family protein n=1 Tax=Erwinia aphidicola TaxID=68334 RepID=UPI001DA1A9BB|nr:aspartyl protease family protein [Erwinia aphidicola]CAH0277258.1 hypothetical protein SRABI13_03669 [Erwinia aphidicola]
MKYLSHFWGIAAALLLQASSVSADSIYAPSPVPLLTVSVRSDALIVPVTIAGKQYSFLLDTGAAMMVIDNRLASDITSKTPDDLLPALAKKILSTGINTSGGMLKGELIRFWQPLALAIGNEVVPASDPWVGADLSAFTQNSGMQIDGIIGQDLYRQFNWAVDNRNHQLTVWKHPLTIRNYQACVPYRDAWDFGPELMLDYHDRPLYMTLNTGAAWSTIGEEIVHASRGHFGSAILTGITQPVITLNGIERSDAYLLGGIQFDRLPLGKLLAIEDKRGNYGLGMNFLQRFDDYLLAPDKMLLCYNQQHFTRDEAAPLRTLAVRYFARRVEIYANSPGALSSSVLHNGDVLLQINGSKVLPEKMEWIRGTLADTPLGELNLRIERRGKVRNVTL